MSAIPVHYYLSGQFVAFYVLSTAWIAPKIGLGNAIFLVLIGQLVAATIIDHHGLLNAPKTPATFTRIAGLGLMVVGIYFARKPIASVWLGVFSADSVFVGIARNTRCSGMWS